MKALPFLAAGALALLLSPALPAQQEEALPPPKPADRQTSDVTISSNKQTVVRDCKGEEVTISGNENKVTLTGRVILLRVLGNDNAIDVEQVGRIETPGTGNRVSYLRGVDTERPETEDTGRKNEVSGKK